MTQADSIGFLNRRIPASQSPSTTPSSSRRTKGDDRNVQHWLGDLSSMPSSDRRFCSITGTWPMRTERGGRSISIGIGSNALASSIVLVCRRRPADAPVKPHAASSLRPSNLNCRSALAHLQRGNIAPVDLAQAAIGPRHGHLHPLRQACSTPRARRSRCARHWRSSTGHSMRRWPSRKGTSTLTAAGRWPGSSSQGFEAGDYGVAETLSKAKNTSIAGMEEAGILAYEGRGPSGCSSRRNCQPTGIRPADIRLTAWEMVHHLARALEATAVKKRCGRAGFPPRRQG